MMSEDRWMSQLKQRGTSSATFFYSALNGWDEATCPGEGDRLSLLIQMQISSRSTLTHTPRNNVFPAVWVSLPPVKLTYKTDHHESPKMVWKIPFLLKQNRWFLLYTSGTFYLSCFLLLLFE